MEDWSHMASMSDVAKLAGVSVSTVSLVCNNKGYVSEATRDRVHDAMRKLGYTPSQLGRNLKLQRSNIIGIVVPDAAHPFFATFIKYAERAFSRRGYKTMVCGTAGREEVEQGYLDMLEQHTMDALIMGAHSLDIVRYLSVSRPLVALDRYLSDAIPTILSDKEDVARKAANLFIERGRKHVIQVTSSRTIRDFDAQKEELVERYLEQHGIKVTNVPTGYNCFTVDQYAETARRALEAAPDADGFFGVDMAATTFMRELRLAGKRVPEDVSVVAIDGTYVTRAGEKIVTAIVQPVEKMAERAADIAIDMVENGMVRDLMETLPVSVQEGETL